MPYSMKLELVIIKKKKKKEKKFNETGQLQSVGASCHITQKLQCISFHDLTLRRPSIRGRALRVVYPFWFE